MGQKNGTSPWVYLAVGCGGLLLVILAVGGFLAFSTYRWAKDVEESIKNPEAREQMVKEALHTDALPEGYHAGFVISIPLLGQIASLTDEPPRPSGEPSAPRERGFFFLNFLNLGNDQELDDFFSGRRDTTEMFSQVRTNEIKFHFPRDSIRRRGSFNYGEVVVDYAVTEGGIELADGDFQGLATLMRLRCSDDERLRLAAWLGPAPAEVGEEEEVDFTGTPGDERAISDFLRQFDLCASR